MLNIESLQALYSEDNYSECLEGTNLFLLFNDQNIEALLLKSKCEYQIACFSPEETDDEADIALYNRAYDSFSAVLKLDPTHEEAMLYMAYISIFMTNAHIPESIVFCNQLIKSPDSTVRLKAFNYRCEARCLTGDFDHAVEDVDRVIDLTKDQYKDNRNAQDLELGLLYLKKANIYIEQDEQVKAMGIFTEAIKYKLNDFIIYCRIANLAFDYDHFELGGEALKKALLMDSEDSQEELLALHHRNDQLIRQGIVAMPMIEGMFIALRIFAGALGCDTVEMLSIAQQYIKIFPDWYIPYNYAGAALYDAESYEAAIPYLQKSLELGGSSYSLYRFIISTYRLTGKLPSVEKWPEDSAPDYYNAGVLFYEFEELNRNEDIARKLLEIRSEFYRIAYESFYDYFYNGKGNIEAAEVHVFAMCCNNYGIALRELGENEKAVEVHKLGYALSPFWEQLYTCGNALINLGRYEEAIEVLNQAAAYGGQYIDFPSYIDIKGCLLDATYHLGREEETWQLLRETEEEYDSFMENYGNDLSKDELFILSERYIVVQNVRNSLLKEVDIEDAIKIWQEQALKHPEDNSNWFMLMQNYYQIKDYKQCIACADNYELIKKDAIKLESKHKVYFMRGMSNLRLGNFTKAKEDLKKLMNACKPGDEKQESIMFDAKLYLAECCFGLKEWDECMTFAWDAIAIYNNNGWRWDDLRTQVTLLYADACKEIGEKKVAIGTINTILEVFSDHEGALRRKKEWTSGGLFSFFKKNKA